MQRIAFVRSRHLRRVCRGLHSSAATAGREKNGSGFAVFPQRRLLRGSEFFLLTACEGGSFLEAKRSFCSRSSNTSSRDSSHDTDKAHRHDVHNEGEGGSKVEKEASATTFSCASNGSSSARPPTTSTSPSELHTFSQGLTDFRWCETRSGTGVFTPAVLQAETIRNRVRLFGMPKGFPVTTATGFRRFFYLSQANSFIADFSACIGYQSLLSGFFLASSPQMWMLKDLFPALIAAYMANRLVSYESRPKQWFCVSVLLRNVTIIADMVIPSTFPNHLVLCAVVNAVMKQSSALMFFITRAAALQHYAIDNNLAELTKKFNSFSMVTFTFATALAIVYCTFLTSFAAQLTTILVCCVANLVLSYMAMSPIAFRILNEGTMQVLLHAYLTSAAHTVMTPQEVSDRMGIRMSPASAMAGQHDATDMVAHLLYISPPVDKLLIRADRLDEDVLYVDPSQRFLLAMWTPSAVPLTLRESWQRWELPRVSRFLPKVPWQGRRRGTCAAEAANRFCGHRLCFLVHQQCTPQDLVRAHLLMHTAVLQHGTTEEELRAFLRRCHAEPNLWKEKGEVLYRALEKEGWDVLLPALDHHDFRLSDLLVTSAAPVETTGVPAT